MGGKQGLTDKYNATFPSRLRATMDEKGITRKELADYLGVTRQSVGYYCDGSAAPSMENLAKIAQYLEVSTDWLLLEPTNVKSIDADIVRACKYTGLSETTIQNIANIVHDPLQNVLLAAKTIDLICADQEKLSVLLASLSTYFNGVSVTMQVPGWTVHSALTAEEISRFGEFIDDAMIHRAQVILAAIKEGR